MTRRGVVVPGTAMRILTGAMLPPGADAVVRVEDTDAPAGVAALPAQRRHPGRGRAGHVRPGRRQRRARRVTRAAGPAPSWPRTGSARWSPRDTPPRRCTGDRASRSCPPATSWCRRAMPLHGARIPDSSSAALRAQVAGCWGRGHRPWASRATTAPTSSSGCAAAWRSRTSWSPAAASRWVPTTRSGWRSRTIGTHRPVAGRHPARQAARVRSRAGAADGRRACCCSGCRATRSAASSRSSCSSDRSSAGWPVTQTSGDVPSSGLGSRTWRGPIPVGGPSCGSA